MKKKTNIQNDLSSRERIEHNLRSITDPIIEQANKNEIIDAESQNIQRATPDSIIEEPKKGKRKTKGDI